MTGAEFSWLRDALTAAGVLLAIALFLRVAVWPLGRRMPRWAPITLMAKWMDDVERQHGKASATPSRCADETKDATRTGGKASGGGS